MTRTLTMLGILAAAAGCPGDTANTSEGPATDASTEPTASTTEEPGTNPTTGTESSTTGETPTTGEAPTTTTDTTGEAPGDGAGAARVVYADDDEVGVDMYFVDCTGPEPGPAVLINHNLPAGWHLPYPGRLSPSQRWMLLVAGHPRLGEEVWLVDMSGPMPGDPVRVELAGEPGFEVLGTWWSRDESRLALRRTSYDGVGAQIYLCDVGADGTCVPEVWNPPLAPGGGIGGWGFAWSPDDSRIAYSGDPDGDEVVQLFLAGTGPGDAGEAIALTSEVPADEAFVHEAWFSPDGATLYYEYGADLTSSAGTRAIDMTTDPPGSPVELPHGDYREDMTAGLEWTGADGLGDLSFFAIDGTSAGPLVPLHDVPGRVSSKDDKFSPDGRFAVYYAETDPDVRELFAVDLSGPTPSAPVKLASPTPGGQLHGTIFGPDPALLFYLSQAAADSGDDLWMVRLDQPPAPVRVNPPLPQDGTIPGFLGFDGDGSRLLYVGPGEATPSWQLWLVDLAAPGAPIEVNAPLQDGQQLGTGARAFSADGQRVFYSVQEPFEQELVHPGFQVDLAAPGVALRVTDPAHQPWDLRVLPPSDG
ncbi:WD40-like Beta Propeller Repeat [Nannocystis exedens]|uniref:WD40-like Beta Propeller Repeat n=1 Tax=Nannocystis exedens TaxID=54 RepID=A0A1I1WLL4_9BACT|nr:PD40 domain-containing protein [Nannocystis exedens]PCC67787.1 hypothetical protein NAEX_00795 [Nannocystis exedens]SFD95278.1 WD40-like Beta Propeller Repeat [Nannocystis exedens]